MFADQTPTPLLSGRVDTEERKPHVDRLHHSLLEEAGVEAGATSPQLFWSGLGAGLAIAFSFIAAAAAAAAAPADWAGIAAAVTYPLGFLIVIGGRYQLYTENTLPPVARVLERMDTVPSLLRLWAVVLSGNLIGAAAIGSLLAVPGVLPDEVTHAAVEFVSLTHAPALSTVFVRALLAGWLVAAMVWLIHRMSRGSTLFVIWACTSLMPLLHLEHVVVGTVEATWIVLGGSVAVGTAVLHTLTALVGNTVGGVLLVTLLNHARTGPVETMHPPLPIRHWLFGLPSPTPQPEILHGIEGDQHWWFTAPERHPVPADLFDTVEDLERAARDYGASKLVLHPANGQPTMRILVSDDPGEIQTAS